MKSAAAQLGQSSEEATATYYISKSAQAPDVPGILERLGTDHGKRPSPAPAAPALLRDLT
ncbi:integrase [Micromonospora taraxaci]|uniref:integrase n=1 Tax=Micromonospora taraxaci TaxID=1316803 RepID=UPI0033FB38A0